VTSSPSCCYFGFGEPWFLLPTGQVLAQVLYFCCGEVLTSARCSLLSSRFSTPIFVLGCRCLRFPPDVICFLSVLISSDCVQNFIAFDPYLAWSDPIEASSFPDFTAVLVRSQQGFPFYFLVKSCSLFLSCLWTSSPGVASARQCPGLLLPCQERAQFTSSWSFLPPVRRELAGLQSLREAISPEQAAVTDSIWLLLFFGLGPLLLDFLVLACKQRRHSPLCLLEQCSVLATSFSWWCDSEHCR
jgi:hypothetical protein